MPVPVDHEKRRQIILDKAVELFGERGYSGVTFRDIAARCGIARTTIYRYFDDKQSVFAYAIQRLTTRLDAEFRDMIQASDASPRRKIRQAMCRILDMLFEYKMLLTVIFEFLLHEKQIGKDIRHTVRRHTIGMRVLLIHLVRDGIEKEEFSEDVAPEAAGSLFYGILESSILQIAVTDTGDRTVLEAEIDLLLDCFENKA